MRERSATLGLAPALPGIVLVVVIVWALAAVLMLTGTITNAREINNAIPIINSQVLPIDEDLDNVKLAKETADLTVKIRDAAAPLSDQADRIITEAQSIDRNAASILVTARAINDTAKAINANALSINDTVSTINSNVVSIHGRVQSIGASVASIGSRVSNVGGNVAQINRRVGTVLGAVGAADSREGGSIRATVNNILGTFVALEPVTRSINGSPGDRGIDGVAAINWRGDVAIGGARLIKGDFEGILTQVGVGSSEGHRAGGGATIHGHANSIDCAPLINVLGPTQYCGK